MHLRNFLAFVATVIFSLPVLSSEEFLFKVDPNPKQLMRLFKCFNAARNQRGGKAQDADFLSSQIRVSAKFGKFIPSLFNFYSDEKGIQLRPLKISDLSRVYEIDSKSILSNPFKQIFCTTIDWSDTSVSPFDEKAYIIKRGEEENAQIKDFCAKNHLSENDCFPQLLRIAIVDTKSGSLIGVNFFDTMDEDGLIEISSLYDVACRGRGIGSYVSTTVLNFLARFSGKLLAHCPEEQVLWGVFKGIRATIHTHNPASMKVRWKSGMRPVGYSDDMAFENILPLRDPSVEFVFPVYCDTEILADPLFSAIQSLMSKNIEEQMGARELLRLCNHDGRRIDCINLFVLSMLRNMVQQTKMHRIGY